MHGPGAGMTTRWARFARGWIAAIVSLFVAACSHSLAGGSLPAAAGIALSLAFSGATGVLLAGKTLSLARLLDPPVPRTSGPRDRSVDFRQSRPDRPLLSTPAQSLL